jgi:hypothetical protein
LAAAAAVALVWVSWSPQAQRDEGAGRSPVAVAPVAPPEANSIEIDGANDAGPGELVEQLGSTPRLMAFGPHRVASA